MGGWTGIVIINPKMYMNQSNGGGNRHRELVERFAQIAPFLLQVFVVLGNL